MLYDGFMLVTYWSLNYWNFKLFQRWESFFVNLMLHKIGLLLKVKSIRSFRVSYYLTIFVNWLFTYLCGLWVSQSSAHILCNNSKLSKQIKWNVSLVHLNMCLVLSNWGRSRLISTRCNKTVECIRCQSIAQGRVNQKNSGHIRRTILDRWFATDCWK